MSLRFRYLKKTLVFSVLAAGVFIFALSCDSPLNPFSNNLGKKVDIEWPTIKVDEPTVGSFLKGEVEFKGSATAYRDLRSVRVSIRDAQGNLLKGWTGENIDMSGEINRKNWTFTLDTTDFFGTGTALPDDLLRIQFQAIDANDLSTDTVTLVYIIKNGPSQVSMSSPDQKNLDDVLAGGVEIPSLFTGTELKGQIVDRRGIKPGWPRIKVWKAGTTEPPDSNPNNWKILPLKWGSGNQDLYKEDGEVVYMDRSTMRIVNTASFSYRLAKTKTTANNNLEYDVDPAPGSSYKNLDPGEYHFRIMTYDSYFTEDPEDKDNYMKPRAPDSGAGEAEAVGYYPSQSGDPYKVTLKTQGTRPTISLYNEPSINLTAKPHIYISSSTERKIKRGPTDSDFRLQVFATHPENIYKATLKYTHGNTVRYLQWTGASGVDNHPGTTATVDSKEGKIFTLTHNTNIAISNAQVTGVDGNGNDTIGAASSIALFPLAADSDKKSDPYYLTVKVFAGDPGFPLTQETTYTLYIDDEDPTVSIRSIAGAASEPDSENNFYRVNGNIKVTADASDNIGIQKTDDTANKSVVKWVVKPAATDTIASELAAFNTNPSAATIGFFNAIADSPTTIESTEGWVGTTAGENDANSFRLNTTQYADGTDLNLYIIAQDRADRLGYKLLKLKVDQDSDKPKVENTSLEDSTGEHGLNAKSKLTVTVRPVSPYPPGLDDPDVDDREPSGNTLQRNVLSNSQSISISFSDDDGIALTGGTNGDVRITLTNELIPAKTGTLTTTQLTSIFSLSGNRRSGNGSLSPSTLAGMVGASGSLPDGFYRLDIRIRDDNTDGVKVRIPGDTYITQQTQEVSYYFAVSNDKPNITIDNPAEGVQVNKDPITIRGTVRTRLQAQDLSQTPPYPGYVWITFDPDVVNAISPVDNPAPRLGAKTYPLDLTLASGTQPDANGYYTYNWERPSVSFIPDGLTYSGFPKFTVVAYDLLGNSNLEVRTVPVDTQGPAINLENITRAITHAPMPTAAQFPNDWPLDFPIRTGGQWNSPANTVWQTFRGTYGVDNWPTEYAFKTSAEVVAALTAENDAAPTVVYNNTANEAQFNDLKLSGTFQDSVSPMWPRPGNDTNFTYFFDNETSPRTAPYTAGSNNMTANWEITIPATLLPDGEHTFGIEASDVVGNKSAIKGLRFIIDRNNPYFGASTDTGNARNDPAKFEVNTNMTPPGNWATKTETERVFSAASPGNNTNKVFQLRGKVFEHNPDKLTIIIGTDGATPSTNYLVTAVWDFQAATQPVDKVNDADTTDRRLNVTGPANVAEYEWTLDIYEKDLKGLVDAVGADSTRRYIKTIITDRANRRSGPLDWVFRLDSQSPQISYTNIETNGSTVFSGAAAAIALKGTVTDDTKIKEIRYKIAKWDYTANSGAGDWRWYDDGGTNNWTATAIPPVAQWNLYANYTTTNAASTVTVNIDNAKLVEAGTSYPANMFNTEGKYRLDLYVTDWSTGYGTNTSGNPYNTATPPADPAPPAPPSPKSAVFFVDRTTPVVAWTGTTQGTPTIPADFYYNVTATKELRIPFTFNVDPDDNTIAAITVKIAGDNISGDITSTIPLNATNGGSGAYTFKPFMTNNGLTGGTLLPDGTYTLTLTVTDGAGRDTARTKQFVLDNTPPVIPVTGTNLNPPQNSVLLGEGVGFSGGVQDDSNQFKRVMYFVATGSGFAAPALPAGVTNWADATDAQLTAAGWHWFDDPTSGKFPTAANPLMDIDNGTHAWKFSIRDTRPLGKAPDNIYVNWTATANRPPEILSTDQYGTLTVYFMAIDLAGNASVPANAMATYWIWPEGDRPKVETIAYPGAVQATNDRDKINGIFSIRGIAQDNERVKYVWFRILRNGTTPATNLKIPNWNTETWDAIAGYQTPQDGADIGDPRPAPTPDDPVDNGWYMARLTSGGGSTRAGYEVSVDSGDLNILTDSEDITIEVRVEDMRISDEGEDRDTLPLGYLSYVKKAYAKIVMNAPKFENEVAYQGPSSAAGTNWRSVNDVHLRGTQASYKVTVTHDVKLNAVFWSKAVADTVMPGGESITFRNSGSRVNLDTTATTDPDIPGVSVKVVKTNDKEWDIIVDVNTEALVTGLNAATSNPKFIGQAVKYPLYFIANDASGTAPLNAQFVAELPIDNKKPDGWYTINRRPAGSNVAIGGDALDAGDVNGISKVVLWFSRLSGTTTYTPVSWKENDGPTAFTNIGTFGGTNDWTNGLAFGTTNNLTGLTAADIPLIPDWASGGGTSNTGGNSAIVIDRHSPNSRAAHHGQEFFTGLSAGGKGHIWYVEMDSTKITSGPIYINFVVIDKAGNAAFFRERLVIMNDAPFINSVTLATDLRRDAGLNAGIVDEGGNTGTTNIAYKTNNDALGAITNSPFAKIKALVTGRDATATTNSAQGIADPINITMSGSGTAWPADDYFTVRNALLALRVQTHANPGVNKERTFRVEYIAQARLLSNAVGDDTGLRNVKAGRVYIINDPGTNVPWGELGAPSSGTTNSWVKGFAFMAAVDGQVGTAPNFTPRLTGTGACSVWELNYTAAGARTAESGVLLMGDVIYTGSSPANADARTAEFVYKNDAFTTGTPNTSIVDDTGKANTYPSYLLNVNGSNVEQTATTSRSLFMVKVFDGPETDAFADFALLAIPVNNNDRTAPNAQLYDLNPKTEGKDDELKVGNNNSVSAIAPKIDDNRTRGGVYNTNLRATTIVKSGHIEPRKTTSLTSYEMGGAATANTATINEPYADRDYFFTTDTVSGQVILRGRSWDQERVQQINLIIGGTTVPILEYNNTTAAGTPTPAPYRSTGLLQVSTNVNATGRVFFTDTLDLKEGHTVEWAYVWDTQTVPNTTTVVGNNINVRVVSFNLQAWNANGTVPTTLPEAGTNKLSSTTALPTVPVNAAEGNVQVYQSIGVNLRPYITGFLRNKSALSHDIRSRQGRYIFARGETVIVAGYNIGVGANNTTNIYLPGSGTNRITIAAGTTADAAERTNYGAPALTTPTGTSGANDTRYRKFTVTAATVFTGTGLVTMSVNNFSAVNTQRAVAGEGSSETTTPLFSPRPLNDGSPVIQPWNIEYDPGKNGSELWDDYTMVHIWRSDENVTVNVDRGRFSKGRFNIDYPSMSINPNDGTLWESHQEGGNWPAGVAYSGGGSYISSNDNNQTTNTGNATGGTGTNRITQVASWSEHMTYTNIYVSGVENNGENFTLWNASSSVTMSHRGDRWSLVGGMFLWGPISSTANNNGNPRISNYPRTTAEANNSGVEMPSRFLFPTTPSQTGHYVIESLWYNGAANSRTVVDPVSLEQFHNPNIVTSQIGNDEHIHISYYDEKDGSLKYRYNRRGNTGWNGTQTVTGGVDSEATARLWVNLDGGADVDDNAPITGRPGRNRTNANSSYTQGESGVLITYDRLGSAAPPTGTDSANYAYEQPTSTVYKSYTLAEANGGTAPADRYLRQIMVQNGQYVKAGDTVVYKFGPQTGGVLVDVYAQATGFIVLNTRTIVTGNTSNAEVTPLALPYQFAANDPVYRIYQVDPTRIRGGAARLDAKHNTGRYNSIAVVNQGYPVIAYYDETSQGLKIAVSNKAQPIDAAADWKVFDTGDIFTGDNSKYATGTGEYVSLQINASDDICDITATDPNAPCLSNPELNYFHIAAMNALTKSVVYIKGKLDVSTNLTNYTIKDVTVQVVDNVGNVGSWCRLSLDKYGNPWIAYMDEGNRGSRDGVKVAYKNPQIFTKGKSGITAGQDQDMYGADITGWEAMHVPTQFSVKDAQLGMERYPTIRKVKPGTRTGTGALQNFAAVGFLGDDFYDIAYYIE